MSLSGFFKFVLGFFIGIFLLTSSGAAVAYYFWTKLSVTPRKPIFAEEQQKPSAKKTNPQQASKPKPNNQPASTPSPEPKKELPPGAYKARVTWKEGLSLRNSPSFESDRIGGIAYNQDVIVLKDSNDGQWQQVRVVEGEQEGWVKSGNTRKVE
jgi:hypothetical protein